MGPYTAAVETLEPRRLLSVAVNDGILTIVGTPQADDIRVNEQAFFGRPKVFVVSIGRVGSRAPAETYTIPADGVRAVSVLAGAGDDVVDLALATAGRIIQVVGITPVNVPAFIDGGLGNDQLFGGNARDRLTGSLGRDQLHGMGGSDTLIGGADNDALDGGDGSDLLHGNAGNDRLNGGAGDDQLLGGDGDDLLGVTGTMLPLMQEPGNDLLVGGPGNDALAGGEGADRILGGAGADKFWNGDAPSEYLDLTPEDTVGPIYMPIS
jgi:Ca2+-binding RTX toxin-like protein